MYETMIKIKDTNLEDKFDKDYITFGELADAYLNQRIEIEILKEKLEEKKETIEEHYAEELHENRMLGVM